MICLIAGNYREAEMWARGQLLSRDEWFYPYTADDLKSRVNFHVLVVGTAGLNVPPSYFERILSLAKSRGRINRA